MHAKLLSLGIGLLLALPAGALAADGAGLGGAFAGVDGAEVAKAIYPGWAPGSMLTWVLEGEHAEVEDLGVFRHDGRDYLAALVATWLGEVDRKDGAMTGRFSCDLHLLVRSGKTLTKVATARSVGGCSGHSTTRLDPAAYPLDGKTALLGLREKTRNGGPGVETLRLYRLEGDTLRPVFARAMVTWDGDGNETRATLTMEKVPDGPSAMKVVEVAPDGRQKSERWGWSAKGYVREDVPIELRSFRDLARVEPGDLVTIKVAPSGFPRDGAMTAQPCNPRDPAISPVSGRATAALFEDIPLTMADRYRLRFTDEFEGASRITCYEVTARLKARSARGPTLEFVQAETNGTRTYDERIADSGE